MTDNITPFPAKTPPHVENYFGGCPTCGEGGAFMNIGRERWFFCEAHLTKWSAGSNVFSDWREEGEEVWRQNAEKLADYRAVEPAPFQLLEAFSKAENAADRRLVGTIVSDSPAATGRHLATERVEAPEVPFDKALAEAADEVKARAPREGDGPYLYEVSCRLLEKIAPLTVATADGEGIGALLRLGTQSWLESAPNGPDQDARQQATPAAIPEAWPDEPEAGRQLPDGTPVVSTAVRALLQDDELRRQLSREVQFTISEVIDKVRRGDANSYNENPERETRFNRADLIWATCLWLCSVSPSALFERVLAMSPDDDGSYRVG